MRRDVWNVIWSTLHRSWGQKLDNNHITGSCIKITCSWSSTLWHDRHEWIIPEVPTFSFPSEKYSIPCFKWSEPYHVAQNHVYKTMQNCDRPIFQVETNTRFHHVITWYIQSLQWLYMSQHVIKHVFSWNWAENTDKWLINGVFSIIRIVISQYFGSDVNGVNFKTLKKSLPLKRQWFFQCFWSVRMLLPGNNLHLQKTGFSKIDISMIFIEFLKIGGFVLKFLG